MNQCPIDDSSEIYCPEVSVRGQQYYNEDKVAENQVLNEKVNWNDLSCIGNKDGEKGWSTNSCQGEGELE